MTTTTTALDLDAIKAHNYRPDLNGAAAYRQADLAAKDVPALLDEAERLRAELANRDMLLEKYRETVGVIAGQREEAKAERDVLREALFESDLGSQILAQWETIAAADADRDRLQAELAQLRAGEADTPGDPNGWPTPAQWIRRWNDATATQRLAMAEAHITLERAAWARARAALR